MSIGGPQTRQSLGAQKLSHHGRVSEQFSVQHVDGAYVHQRRVINVAVSTAGAELSYELEAVWLSSVEKRMPCPSPCLRAPSTSTEV